MEDKNNEIINPDDNAGNLGTLIMRDKAPQLSEKMILAPGEGRSPENILQEQQPEILIFPTIYAGQPKPALKDRKIAITRADERRWELRAKDRRVALCVPNIFFKYHKMQKEQLPYIMMVKLRIKKQSNRATLNAGTLRSKSDLNSLAKDDVVFPEFKILRGSPQ